MNTEIYDELRLPVKNKLSEKKSHCLFFKSQYMLIFPEAIVDEH